MDATNFFQPKRPPRREQEQQPVDTTPENALLPQSDGATIYKRFVMHPTTLSIPDDVTTDEWIDFGSILKQFDTAISWVIGEWAEYANKTWGYSYEQIAAHFGYEESTLMNYASIVRKIPTSLRNPGLTFSHHRLVANLPENQKQYWLEQAAANGWKLSQMKAAMHPLEKPNKSAITARKARKRVREFVSEIEEIAKDLDAEDRQELASMFTKLARKISR